MIRLPVRTAITLPHFFTPAPVPRKGGEVGAINRATFLPSHEANASFHEVALGQSRTHYSIGSSSNAVTSWMILYTRIQFDPVSPTTGTNAGSLHQWAQAKIIIFPTAIPYVYEAWIAATAVACLHGDRRSIHDLMAPKQCLLFLMRERRR